MWSTTIDVEFFANRCFKAEAKVDDFDILGGWVDEYVVKLEVTMHVPLPVHVGNALHDLAEDCPTLFLRQPLVWLLFY
jgi:hypothetical protein